MPEPAPAETQEVVAARWRPGPAEGVAGLWILAGLVLWPLFGGDLLERFSARGLGIALALIGLASTYARIGERRAVQLVAGLLAFGLGLAAALGNTPVPIQLLPALLYLGLGVFFLRSLREEDSIIEQAARTLEPEAPGFIRSYCRKLTGIWALLFFANAGAIGYLAVFGTWTAWLDWTTAGTWIGLAGFSLAEFLFRKSWFRYYFYGGVFDRFWSTLFPAEATARGRRSAAYIAKMKTERPLATSRGLWTDKPPASKSTGHSSRFQRWTRILTTGSAFALFGVASLGLAALAPLITRSTKSDPDASSRRIQRLVSLYFRAFTRYMQWTGILRLELHGEDLQRLAPGRIVVANHPTLLDVVLLVAQLPQADCVVKRAAWSNLFLRGPVRAAGYIPNDEGQALLDSCMSRLAAGRSVLLFPEGTRSPREGLGTFQRGAAHIALAAGVDIVPVRIHCEPPSLMRGQKWYDVPDRAMHYTIHVGEPLSSDPYQRAMDAGEGRGLVARHMTAALRKFFETKRD